MLAAMNVLVRYHEIALKGRMRPFFVQKLEESLERATSDLGEVKVRVLSGRVHLQAAEGITWESLRERVSRVFGVANFSRTFEVSHDLDLLTRSVVASVQELRESRPFATFRVVTKRSYKQFALNSSELDRRLGLALCQATGARVNLRLAELTLFVEVLKDRILYSFEKVPGPGGFAVGSSGRVMPLLSGGIDSPVAAYRMMKRGCRVTPVHFHAFPLLDRATIDKARELAKVLTRYQFRTRLLLAPFAPVQQAIVASCPAPLRVILYRRFMIRIAEALAARHRAKALVTGDSLGQVASQTLDNIAVVDEVARRPVLRPLIGMDKDEITAEARRIGSFEISTLPDQDCCQLYVPRSPATAATLEELQSAEHELDVPALVARCVADTTVERFEFPQAPVAPGELALAREV